MADLPSEFGALTDAALIVAATAKPPVPRITVLRENPPAMLQRLSRFSCHRNECALALLQNIQMRRGNIAALDR